AVVRSLGRGRGSQLVRKRGPGEESGESQSESRGEPVSGPHGRVSAVELVGLYSRADIRTKDEPPICCRSSHFTGGQVALPPCRGKRLAVSGRQLLTSSRRDRTAYAVNANRQPLSLHVPALAALHLSALCPQPNSMDL